jgi:uncharacterized protein YfdQ (DUF2303 family)
VAGLELQHHVTSIARLLNYVNNSNNNQIMLCQALQLPTLDSHKKIERTEFTENKFNFIEIPSVRPFYLRPERHGGLYTEC